MMMGLHRLRRELIGVLLSLILFFGWILAFDFGLLPAAGLRAFLADGPQILP